jgi:hypothetical protein
MQHFSGLKCTARVTAIALSACLALCGAGILFVEATGLVWPLGWVIGGAVTNENSCSASIKRMTSWISK